MIPQHFIIMIIRVLPLIGAYPISDNEDNNVEDVAIDISYLGQSIFKAPDPEVGKRLEGWNETSEVNPEEFGEYADGDIRFPDQGRNGMLGEAFRWKNGVVPYQLSGSFTSNDKAVIKRAMDIYNKYTCVTQKTSADQDYLAIVSGPTGCWSSVGRIGGRQEVNLQSPYCTTKVGTPLHELMHALGFLHEQNRYERDDYVSIAWQNVKKGHEANFDKASKSSTTGFGVPYDFRSVMHYSNTAFSINSKPTIIPKDTSKNEKMGQRDGFSKGDITKINAMYNCPDKTGTVTKGNNGQSSSSSASKDNGLISAVEGFLSLFKN